MHPSDIVIPGSLAPLTARQDGAAWVRGLPETLAKILDAWDLTLIGQPFTGGSVSLALPVARDQETYVLKLQWPHPEAAQEADALTAWAGRGVVHLIAHNAQEHALLLEECRPGSFLADCSETDPIDVFADLLPRLWVQPHAAFRSLADEAHAWADGLANDWEKAGKSCERRLIDAALDHIDTLAGTQGPQVLLHQDLHGHNVLSARREPWLAIDPKPLIGERAFSLAPIVRSFEFGHTKQATIARLDRLTDALDVDRQRALGWTVAQTMAWGFGGSYDAVHHQTVRWLIDAA